jgi:hypothetical protein
MDIYVLCLLWLSVVATQVGDRWVVRTTFHKGFLGLRPCCPRGYILDHFLYLYSDLVC